MTDLKAANLTIDVVSDVVCPWCYVGKRNLEAALALRPDLKVDVRYRPFQLDATLPPEGMDRTQYMVRKFGSLDRLKDAHQRLEDMGNERNIHFDFAAIKRSPNTLDAHRIIRWAASVGKQPEVKERLMSLYFEHGADVGDRTVLLDVAENHGMNRETVAKTLEDGTDIIAVQTEIEQAQAMGVSGVPFFILAGKYGVSGAQPVEAMLSAIDQAAAE